MNPRNKTGAPSKKNIPVRLAAKKSTERGREHIEDAKPPFQKATAIELKRNKSCAVAFRVIAGSCLSQIDANEPGMLAGDVEALHQFRIGFRRLRAAFKAFAEMIADPNRDAIKAELKWVMTQVGPARDLDVFGADVLEPLERGDDPHLAAAHRSYEEMRKKANETVERSIRSARFKKILLDLTEWIEAGPWTSDPALKEMRERNITKHAANVLGQWRKSLRKRCRKLDELSPEQRHRLRIRAKDLRYVTEFFASLFPKHTKRREAALAALEKLQDTLGALNDLTARKRIMPKEVDQSVHARRVIAAQEGKAGDLLEEAKTACAKLGELKPFWE
jgi:CHAD domain-containing protein